MVDINKRLERRRKLWLIKADIELKRTLEDIRLERIKKGLDNEKIPYRDLLKGAFRYPPLLDILKKADIRRENLK